MCRTDKLNSRLSLSHLQQLIWDQIQINIRTEHLEAHASNPTGQCMPLIWYNPCDCFYSSTERVTMLTGFPKTRWPRLRFSESYAVWISVKILWICEFPVLMGIMTGLLGCCLSNTLGSRANDYVKTLATLRFSLHHLPCSLGCWRNNTLAARSLSPKYSSFSTDMIKYVFVFSIIFQYWDGTGSCNPSLWKRGTCLPYIVNFMVANDLAVQGTRASAAMEF